MEKTVLVLPGKHANADNFDIVAGKAEWNRDWSYEYEGNTLHYKKGQKAFSEVLKKFSVWQQPATFADGTFL